MSHVTCHMSVVKVVGGGPVINRACPVQFTKINPFGPGCGLLLSRISRRWSYIDSDKETFQRTAGCLGAGYTNILPNLDVILSALSQHQTDQYEQYEQSYFIISCVSSRHSQNFEPVGLQQKQILSWHSIVENQPAYSQNHIFRTFFGDNF